MRLAIVILHVAQQLVETNLVNLASGREMNERVHIAWQVNAHVKCVYNGCLASASVLSIGGLDADLFKCVNFVNTSQSQ